MASFWDKIREDFPITKRWIYLDHAAGGPIPEPVRRSILKYYQEHSGTGDLPWNTWVKRREKIRRHVARFIHAEPSEIAFTHSTSQGMNLIAELLARQGKVLLNTSEFPASTMPWLWRKARIRWMDPVQAKLPVSIVERMLQPAVKTIVTSFVQYATGFRQEMEKLGGIKGNRFLVVNATQGFGVLPIDVKKWRSDFLCTNSYKWLMGGYGGGILYLNKKWIAKMRPSSVGWRSMRDPEAMDNRRIAVKKNASRYEWGCPSFPTLFGLGAAVEYLDAIGIERVEKRVLSLTDFAIEELEKRAIEVISPREPEHRSGIVVFKVKNPKAVCRRLLRHRIYASPRGVGIRISPHFYNNFEEIETFVKKLEVSCKR